MREISSSRSPIANAAIASARRPICSLPQEIQLLDESLPQPSHQNLFLFRKARSLPWKGQGGNGHVKVGKDLTHCVERRGSMCDERRCADYRQEGLFHIFWSS